MNARTRTLVIVLAAVIVVAVGVVLYLTGALDSLFSGGGEVIAKVNGDAITLEQVDGQLAVIEAQYPTEFQGEQGEARRAQMRQSIFESLVNTVIMRQGAEDRGIEITDDEVEASLTSIKNGFASEAEFEQRLEQNNTTLDELRDQIRDQLTYEKLLEVLAPASEVTDADIEAYYQERAADFGQEEVLVRHILFNENDKDLAERVLDEVKAGGDFATLATQYSQDPGSAAAGGELGWSSSGQWVPEFKAAVDAMEPGEIADGLVHTDYGWHIIELMDRRSKTFEDVADQVRTVLVQQRQIDAYQAFVDELRAAADIKIYDDTFTLSDAVQ